ncbi:hypothetical protein CF87_gp01 [Sulfolobus monocaudavirus SMV1]|uniref:hypothetical protein n=1 Tax=Sulfolobus monocaudavirus SMV1 TaxID=1351702 RepID=UPI0003D85510|nr:hypothetical protein CF87_gp01 [Sulfolobus monocaudavirus SMV1]CDF81328.1 hypothetical protein [Sulfolobus monocaudavirus SMV1]
MELSGKVIVKEVLYKELENGGAIVVYKVVNEDPNLLFNDFYFATFDNTSSEEVFGVGYDIESALEDAERKLQKELGGVSILKDNKGIYSGIKIGIKWQSNRKRSTL